MLRFCYGGGWPFHHSAFIHFVHNEQRAHINGFVRKIVRRAVLGSRSATIGAQPTINLSRHPSKRNMNEIHYCSCLCGSSHGCFIAVTLIDDSMFNLGRLVLFNFVAVEDDYNDSQFCCFCMLC